jgi:hypothetical protein
MHADHVLDAGVRSMHNMGCAVSSDTIVVGLLIHTLDRSLLRADLFIPDVTVTRSDT